MPETDPSQAAPTQFENVVPILRVESLPASLDYYQRVLGFTLDWHAIGVMASVSRDHHAIMLCEGDQGHAGTWLWIGVGDAEALFNEYASKGAKIRRPPANFPWAYEVHVEDPDGHVLRFGSDSREDRPFDIWR